MAGEFKHKTVGTQLTQAEWEAIAGHRLDSQATDDMIVASSATQLSRLAVAASRIIGKLGAGNLKAMTVAELLTLINVADGADVTGSNAPQAHKASHENAGGDAIKLDDLSAPDDNTDLDVSTAKHGLTPKGTNVGDFLKDDGTWAAPAGGGGGNVNTGGTPIALDIARFTDATTIEGRSYAEIKDDLDLEVGKDVLAEQTIGITDNNLVEVDGPTAGAPANGEYAKWTANGLEGKSKAEHLSDLNVADGADVTGSNAPQAHKASHENAGGDEVNVGGLSGLLVDDQHVLDAEVINVAIAISLLTTRGDIIFRNATVPARLAKGSSGEVLTMGANDPAWAAPAGGGGGLTYTELAGGDNHQVASASTWENWDISGVVPAGTEYVEVGIHSTFSGGIGKLTVGVRNNGSALDRKLQIIWGYGMAEPTIVVESQCDASRIIEVFDGDGTKRTRFNIMGYWS